MLFFWVFHNRPKNLALGNGGATANPAINLNVADVFSPSLVIPTSKCGAIALEFAIDVV